MEEVKEFEATEMEGTEEQKDEQVWLNAKGEEVSKSAFIREKFELDNMSRKEISDKFDIPYRTVYGATVNMVNDAEPSSRGRGVVNPKIKVTAEQQVLIEKDGQYLLNGEEITEAEAEALEVEEVDRNTWIKEQVANGVSRGDVAKALDLSYGVIYGLTKDEEGVRQTHMVTLDDGTEVTRAEYIRQRVAEGAIKAEVAKELGVEYSVVWQATKKNKTEQERFEDAIEALKKFVGKAEPADDFEAVLNALEEIAIPEADEEEEEDSLESKKVDELKEIAAEMEVEIPSGARKDDIIAAIRDAQ